MTKAEKMEKLAEILDLEVDEIDENGVLEDIDEWDSVARLSFIAMMDEEFGKAVKGSQVRGFVTVQDVLNAMEA